MADVYRLFGAGLKWSYKKYGIKGAFAFVLAGTLAYYFLDKKLEEFVERKWTSRRDPDIASS